MIMRLVLPRYEKVHFLSGICSLFMRKEDEVHYIGGAEILPPPLEGEREAYCIRMLDGVHAERARKELIEHNLRLVVYIAKKFDNTGVGVEDLISIGTIGLIKGINTFNPDKNIKLATYASRCIENEILMYLRRNSKTKLEVSIDEPLNVDWDGNELLLSDILGTDEDVVGKDMETDVERKLLKAAIEKLSAKSVIIQKRKQTGMINMCVCHEHIIHRCCIHRNLLIHIQIRSLLHTTIHQYMFIPECYIMTASCHLMRCTQKFYLHLSFPLSVNSSPFSSDPHAVICCMLSHLSTVCSHCQTVRLLL